MLLLPEKKHEALNLVFGDRPLPQAVARSASVSKYPILDMVEMSILPLTSDNNSTIHISRPSPRHHLYMNTYIGHRSYLQPGGEREWKVERENISALSAIFFLKRLESDCRKSEQAQVHSRSIPRERTDAVACSLCQYLFRRPQ